MKFYEIFKSFSYFSADFYQNFCQKPPAVYF
jgi:hypothetical protein